MVEAEPTNGRNRRRACDAAWKRYSGKTFACVFADDPIATTNATWDKAVKDGVTPTVGGNGNWNYDVHYPEAGLGGGVSGNAAGNPILNSVKIVTTSGTNQVVTSFPK